jgi:hypothetical protein
MKAALLVESMVYLSVELMAVKREIWKAERRAV